MSDGIGGHHERHAHEERRVRLLVDVDAGGQVGERGAGRRDQLRDPHQDEVALPEHRRGRDPGSGLRLGHGTSLASAPRAVPHLHPRPDPPAAWARRVRLRRLGRSVVRVRVRFASDARHDKPLIDEDLARAGARAMRAVRARRRGGPRRLPRVPPAPALPPRRDRVPPGRPGRRAVRRRERAGEGGPAVARHRRARDPRHARPGRVLRGAGDARRGAALGVGRRARADRDARPRPRRLRAAVRGRADDPALARRSRSPASCGASPTTSRRSTSSTCRAASRSASPTSRARPSAPATAVRPTTARSGSTGRGPRPSSPAWSAARGSP